MERFDLASAVLFAGGILLLSMAVAIANSQPIVSSILVAAFVILILIALFVQPTVFPTGRSSVDNRQILGITNIIGGVIEDRYGLKIGDKVKPIKAALLFVDWKEARIIDITTREGLTLATLVTTSGHKRVTLNINLLAKANDKAYAEEFGQ